MDSEAVLLRMSELENRLKQVVQDRNNYAAMIVNYEEFLRHIPRCLPPHKEIRDALTPMEWLKWATTELGY